MPTLPTSHPATVPDAWHEVTSPGGYEWWYFDAEDVATDTRVVVILLDGFVFHPEYLRRYYAYLGRPTRHAPPRAREYPCAYCVVYRGGKILTQFMTRYAEGSCVASREGPHVDLGPNRLRFDQGRYQLHAEGSPWQLTWQGPRRSAGGVLQADLEFSPTLANAPHERRFLSREMTGADHHWVLAAPLCGVKGVIRHTPAAGMLEEVIEFNGRGVSRPQLWQCPARAGTETMDLGTGPSGGPGVGLSHRGATRGGASGRDATWSRSMRGARVNQPMRSRNGPERVGRPSAWRTRRRSTSWGSCVCPTLGSSMGPPFYLRLVHDALLPDGATATAFCEIAYPHRLRWPLLGRMIEMSIELK